MNRLQCNDLLFLIVILSCLSPSRFYRLLLNSSINVDIQPNGAGYGIGGGASGNGGSAGGYGGGRTATTRSRTPAGGGLRMAFFDFDETITKTSGLSFNEEIAKKREYWWFLFGFHNEIIPPSLGQIQPQPQRVEALRDGLSRLKSEGVTLAILSHHQVDRFSGMEQLTQKLVAADLFRYFDEEIWVKSADKQGYDKWHVRWPEGRNRRNFVEAGNKQAAMNKIALLQGAYSEQLMVLVDDKAHNLKGLLDAKNLSTVGDGESRKGIYGFQVNVVAFKAFPENLRRFYDRAALQLGVQMKETQPLGGFAPLPRSADFDQLIKLFN